MIGKMLESIITTDSYILWFAILTLIALVYCLVREGRIRDRIETWKRKHDPEASSITYNDLSVAYSVFLALVSIFPLLGMLGTVSGLLGIDFSSGNMENIKANFFTALTSTAWGIVFSIAFKVINAFFSTRIESQIEEAKLVAEVIHAKSKKKNR